MIENTIDLHIHGAPDIVPRKMQEEDIAKKALIKGMKAVVFKSHNRSTIDDANSINKQLGVEIAHSALVLNKFCGLNPEYVEKEIQKGVKIIYMPTIDSVSHSKEGISILENKQLKKEVLQILKIIAKHNVSLATGHIPNNEVLTLIKEAKILGVNKIIITHPDLKINKLSLNLQKKLSKEGVYFERTFYSCIHPNFPEKETAKLVEEKGQKFSIDKIKEIINHIMETGIANNLLTSDLGQPQNLDPIEGFEFYLRKMKEFGLTEIEIGLMVKVNPAKLLGLNDFFVKEYVKNKVLIEEKKLDTKYREPVIGFSDANNKLFNKLKKVARSTHKHPKDFIKNAKTVISIFLPFSETIIKSNYGNEHPSKEWAIAYTETNELLDKISEDLANEFKKLGFFSIGMKTTHHLSHAHKDHYEYDELFSDWSQRHVAYICGVGKFGFNNLIITKRGCAGRIGSLIVSAKINPTKFIKDEYCLVKRGKDCYQCIKNCPAKVLKEMEFDRIGCMNYLIKQRKYQEEVYKLKEGTQTCGKCSTNIPCEIKIPE